MWKKSQLWGKLKFSVVHINLSTIPVAQKQLCLEGISHFTKCKCEKKTGSFWLLSPKISSIWFPESLFYTTLFDFLLPSPTHLSGAPSSFRGCGSSVWASPALGKSGVPPSGQRMSLLYTGAQEMGDQKRMQGTCSFCSNLHVCCGKKPPTSYCLNMTLRAYLVTLVRNEVCLLSNAFLANDLDAV